MRVVLLVSIILLPLLVLPALALPEEEALKIEIIEWRLPNGLHVIFSPHRRVPAVTVQVWYHAGSKDERPGARGIAHMFEHMMFKGSRAVPPEEHARMLSALGGEENAFTAEDVTAYHNTVPRQYMEFAMELEADRMRHLYLTPRSITSEREVVKEEKRMRLENSPIGRAEEAIQALAYIKHPYAWTPAGVIEDLNRVTEKECQAFYDTYYVPNNATLIVVGDVTVEEVRQAALRQFGSIKPGKDPPRVTIVEPPQTKLREKRADWPSQLKVVLGAYHVPAANHADLPALEVLNALLSAGQSSRLHQALVRKTKLAVAAGGFLQSQEQPGLFMLYAVGLPSQDVTKMKEALLAEGERLAQSEVTTQELTKVKNQLATATLSHLETLGGLAFDIGQSLYLEGDPRAFLKNVARLDRVTTADVKRVAKTYLQRRNLSLVLLDQTPAGGQR